YEEDDALLDLPLPRVQTFPLPITAVLGAKLLAHCANRLSEREETKIQHCQQPMTALRFGVSGIFSIKFKYLLSHYTPRGMLRIRSEERRVGRECRTRCAILLHLVR